MNCDKRHNHTRTKPWWSDKLSYLWDIRCNSEKNMCKAHPGNITEMRQQFVSDQRDFDVEVRHAKRQYWQHQQEELLARRHSPDFWKFFGRIGIQNNIKHHIPWEVVIEDGSISVDHDVVLNS